MEPTTAIATTGTFQRPPDFRAAERYLAKLKGTDADVMCFSLNPADRLIVFNGMNEVP